MLPTAPASLTSAWALLGWKFSLIYLVTPSSSEGVYEPGEKKQRNNKLVFQTGFLIHLVVFGSVSGVGVAMTPFPLV